jgi:hypothetical protein
MHEVLEAVQLGRQYLDAAFDLLQLGLDGRRGQFLDPLLDGEADALRNMRDAADKTRHFEQFVLFARQTKRHDSAAPGIDRQAGNS